MIEYVLYWIKYSDKTRNDIRNQSPNIQVFFLLYINKHIFNCEIRTKNNTYIVPTSYFFLERENLHFIFICIIEFQITK